MEPEITVIAGRGGEAAASVSLDETRVNRLILQVCGHARVSNVGLGWPASAHVDSSLVASTQSC